MLAVTDFDQAIRVNVRDAEAYMLDARRHPRPHQRAHRPQRRAARNAMTFSDRGTGEVHFSPIVAFSSPVQS
jgi:hypothetical protein